jgi:hypothetical protein
MGRFRPQPGLPLPAAMAAGTDIGIGLAALSAMSAAMSARASARGVALSHRPYVYGERRTASGAIAEVQLHNDGPGTAVEVRWRLWAPGAEPTEWSEPILALQPGEILPPSGEQPLATQLPPGVDGHQFEWYVETQFSDIRGARWRLLNERGARQQSVTLRRMRSRRFELWRAR